MTQSRSFKTPLLVYLIVFLSALGEAVAASLPQTIAALKPSIVAIGTLQRNRSPAITFFATGLSSPTA